MERLYDLVAILMIFFIAQLWLPPLSWFRAAIAMIVPASAIIAVAAIPFLQ